MGVDSHLQLATVLENLPDDTSAEMALEYLGPILTKSEEEQLFFRKFFHEHGSLLGFASFKQEAILLESPEWDEPAPAAPAFRMLSKTETFFFSLIAAVMLGIVIIGGYASLFPIKGCTHPLSRNYNPKAWIDDGSCILPPPPGCMDSAAINYNPLAIEPCNNCCRYLGENLDKEEESTNTQSGEQTTYIVPFAPKDPNLPPLIPLNRDLRYWAYQYRLPLLTAFIGILCVLFLGQQFYRNRRKRYIAQRTLGNESPYYLPIQIKEKNEIRFTPSFFESINLLRGRQDSTRQKLNIPKTIKETIKRGRLLDLQYLPLRKSIEYLFLIDKNAEQNHRAQLNNAIYEKMLENEVYATRFYYDTNPTICWNESYPDGLLTKRLARLYPEARLLIFSNGYSFLNPMNGTLREWTEVLETWEHRALLTHTPSSNWNYRETTLAQFFAVIPNRPHGWSSLSHEFNQWRNKEVQDWKQLSDPVEPIFDLEKGPFQQTLNRFFSNSQQRWLAATAIYPELHWDLTIKIGHTLSEEDELVTYENLHQLTRIDWFRKGAIPDKYREKLLANPHLSKEDKEKVREAVIRILMDNLPSNTNSRAYEECQLQLSINHLLLDKSGPDHLQWLQKYQELHAKGMPGDAVSVQEMDIKFASPLRFLLPESFVKQLFIGGRATLGYRDWPTFIPFLACICALIWGFNWVEKDCFSEADYIGAKAYCLENRSDSLLYFTHAVSHYLETDQIGALDSLSLDLLSTIDSFSVQSKDLQLYYHPVLNAVFNKTLSYYDSKEYPNAISLHQKIKRFNLFPNSIFQGEWTAIPGLDTFALTTLDYHQLLALSRFYLGSREEAREHYQQIITGPAYQGEGYFKRNVPNLVQLLKYDFVDGPSDGLVRVRKDGQFGFLDSLGNEAIPLQPNFVENFLNGRALTTFPNQKCFIDRQGSVIPDLCFDQLTRRFGRNGKWGYAAEDGRFIIAPIYEDAYPFAEERALVRFNSTGGYGFINAAGRTIAPFVYQEAKSFSEGFAAVRKDDKWGYINRNGQVVVPIVYDQASSLSNARAKVTVDGIDFGLKMGEGGVYNLEVVALVSIDAIANSAIDAGAMPGCQVFAMKNGAVIYNKAFGYHTYAEQRPVRLDDLYDVSSLMKILGTTIAAMKLYEEGKLQLNGKVKDYLSLKSRSTIRNIEIRSLLSHQSGLQPNMPVSPYVFVRDSSLAKARYFQAKKEPPFTIQVADSMYFNSLYQDSIWNAVQDLEISSKQDYRYSDVNFILLQRIIESITSQSLDSYLEATFYSPMGLDRTCLNPLQKFPKSEIIPTQYDDKWRMQLVHGHVHDESAALLGGVGGNAGLFSTAEQSGVILQMLINGGSLNGRQYLLPTTIDYFTRAIHGNHRGLGFDKPYPNRQSGLPPSAPLSTFGHTGFSGAAAWADPDNDLVYVFLSNRIHPDRSNAKLIQLRVRDRIHQVIYDAFGL